MMKIICACIGSLTVVGFAETKTITDIPSNYEHNIKLETNEGNLKKIYTFIETPDDVDSIECLAKNIYFEARGESEDGQIAVANVTLNRVDHPDFPDDICSVVYQKKQFSWTYRLKNKTPKDIKVYKDIYNLAENVYYNQIGDITDGALFFHATRIKPYWSKKMTEVAIIDKHIFYRP